MITLEKVLNSKLVLLYTHKEISFVGFRDVEIMNLVQQQSWLQIVKGEEMNHLAKGVPRPQEDLNYNKWL